MKNNPKSNISDIKFSLSLFIIYGLTVFSSYGQEMDHTNMEIKSDTAHMTGKNHNMEMKNDSMPMMNDMPMSHAYSLNLPMSRNASGTAWQPDASPMYGYMKHYEKWMFMFHGSVFIRYNKQDLTDEGSRGGEKVDAPNWFMAMGQRNIGKKGLFHFNGMFSLDPLTIGEEGYPLLFQTGENYQGKPLVDKQHPHDLFDELSVAYTHMLTKEMDITGYIAYPGEPAYGPVAFMHRPSSFNNPDAPLGHHWQDATHITFGVATLGFRFKKLKLESSLFTGREPNEERYDFDKPRFDSYSMRLSYNPNANFSLQASHAEVKGHEELEPEDNLTKHSVSISHACMPGEKQQLTSALIWGANQAHGELENSILAESNLEINKMALYGRYEWIQKNAKDLQIPQPIEVHETFIIQMLTIGLSYNFLTVAKTNLRAGLQGSYYMPDKSLDTFYGKNPTAVEIYLRLTPMKL